MVSRAHTVAFWGVEARAVAVECATGPGLPSFQLVGLADKACSESRERVRAALGSIGLAMPANRVTINLSPADMPKAGSHFDLAIALALMTELGVLPADEAARHVAIGELALDGTLLPGIGALPAALAAAAADRALICPEENGPEAAWVGGAEILAPASLIALANHFSGRAPLAPPRPGPVIAGRGGLDLADVKGQETARRALEVAAAGGHHMLMVGEPGSGKSMLARRLVSILPPLSPAEALEVTTIHSLAGETGGAEPGAIHRDRPFRDPHHTASKAAMVGGGQIAKPGQISLAHRGVLFLDELPEFDRGVLEALRQPIETGEVLVSRANAHMRYPARFLMVAAMNPCRCGYLSDASRACSRAPRCGADYAARLSGPLLDRFDIRIDLPPVTPDLLALPPHGETSTRVAARVAAARAAQAARAAEGPRPPAPTHPAAGFAETPPPALAAPPTLNSELEGAALDRVAAPDAGGAALLAAATERLRLSARGHARILRLARTIADLEGATTVGQAHVAEAVSYRRSLA